MQSSQQPTANSQQPTKLTQTQRDEILARGHGYEPSQQVKECYLARRKKARTWAGVDYPGLFDYDPANDKFWFYLTLFLELLGLSLIALLLYEAGRVGVTGLIITTIAFLIWDIAFAYFHHISKGKKCLFNNREKLFIPDMRPGVSGYAKYHAALETAFKDDKSVRYGSPASALVIWLTSLVKCFAFVVITLQSAWFYSAVENSVAPYFLIIVICFIYLWIAHNHLNYTGYFMAAYSYDKKYNSEELEYNRSIIKGSAKNEKQIIDQPIDFEDFYEFVNQQKPNNGIPDVLNFISSSQNLKNDLAKGIKELEVDGHGISLVGGYIYTIYSHGLLKDEQLQKMIEAQSTQLARFAVAMYGHYLQMRSGNFQAGLG